MAELRFEGISHGMIWRQKEGRRKCERYLISGVLLWWIKEGNKFLDTFFSISK